MALFFGNKDVEAIINVKQGKLSLGKLDKMLIITNEDDIPGMALSGSDGIEELNKYLTDNSKTAPNLVAALKTALGQEDNSNNKLVPEYIYVLGVKTSGDNAAVFTAIEELDKLDTTDFYGIATSFEDVKFEEWAQTYSKPRTFATMTTSNRTLSDKSQSARIFGQNFSLKGEESDRNDFNNVAWMARLLFSKKLTGAKFKMLKGVEADELTDAKVLELEKGGWNGYRRVRGKGQTTGSICTDKTTHIDQTILRDTINYNVANVLMDMFVNEEIIDMGFDGKKTITTYINQALVYCGELGLISKGEDGRYLFSVEVPEITATMRSLREIKNLKFSYQPTVPLERITVTGNELLEWGDN